MKPQLNDIKEEIEVDDDGEIIDLNIRPLESSWKTIIYNRGKLFIKSPFSFFLKQKLGNFTSVLLLSQSHIY